MSDCDDYKRRVMKVVVAQVCQTIGLHSIQLTPLELLTDVLHKFLQELTRDVSRHVELYNRTEANLNDVALSLSNLDIHISDLQEYISHVEPVSCAIEVPKIPVRKESNLNFLKPGSDEVLTRPVHIYEYLPPINPQKEKIEKPNENITLNNSTSIGNQATNAHPSSASISINLENEENVTKSTNITTTTDGVFKRPEEATIVTPNKTNSLSTLINSSVLNSRTIRTASYEGESRPIREISSVMMTSSGFISPARQGKLPDTKPPNLSEFNINEVEPTVTTTLATSATLKGYHVPTHPPALPVSGLDNKFEKKAKKKQNSDLNNTMSNSINAVGNENDPKTQRKLLKLLRKNAQRKGGLDFPMNSPTPFPKGNGEKVDSLHQNMSTEKASKKHKQKQKRLSHNSKQYEQQKSIDEAAGLAIGDEPINDSMYSNQNSNSKGSADGIYHIPKKSDKNLNVSTFDNSSDIHNRWPSNLHSNTSKKHSMLSNNNPHSEMGNETIVTNTVPLLHRLPSQSLSSTTKHEDIKITTEPDKMKLNIFKKISSKKDRGDLDAGPNTSAKSPKLFHDNQVITLPSGTTITPALPSANRKVYAPPVDNDQIICVEDENNSNVRDNYPKIGTGIAPIYRMNLPMHTKSNKKSSSKLAMKSKTIQKSPKKPKKSKHAGGIASEPLNLSGASNMWSSKSQAASEMLPLMTEKQRAHKEKKERKKAKNLKRPIEQQNTLENLRHQSKEISNLDPRSTSTTAMPTQEEFASINKKLLKMDTVLKHAPSDSNDAPKKMGGQQEYPENFMNEMCPPFLSGMPFYAFPPRPGLIPSFSPLLHADFFKAGRPGGVGPGFSGLMPGRQPSLKPTFEKHEKSPSPDPSPFTDKRSYCNVAPIVPESMKLHLSPSPKSSKSSLPATPGNSLNFDALRSKTTPSSTSVKTISDITPIEVSDDSQDEGLPKTPSITSSGGSVSGSAPVNRLNQRDGNSIDIIKLSSTSLHHLGNKKKDNVEELSENANLSPSSTPTTPRSSPNPASVNQINDETDEEIEGVENGSGPFEYSMHSPVEQVHDEKLEHKHRKEHKKMKKVKEGKIKKKKDKKDKNKSKDRDKEKFAEKSEKRREKEEKKEKEKMRKLKKEKKREKMRGAEDIVSKYTGIGPSASAAHILERPHSPTIPKLKLKFGGSCKSPTPDSLDGDGIGGNRKVTIKSSHRDQQKYSADDPNNIVNEIVPIRSRHHRRESSPELARISPLVTRPPKQKSSTITSGQYYGESSTSSSHMPNTSTLTQHSPVVLQPTPTLSLASQQILDSNPVVHRGPGRPKGSGNKHKDDPQSQTISSTTNIGVMSNINSMASTKLTTSSLLIPSTTGATAVNAPCTDGDGNEVWICPACGKVDDGTPMIGCDGCDAWYHWVCVGIQVPPDENESWYCRVCLTRKQQESQVERKRKRKKKSKTAN